MMIFLRNISICFCALICTSPAKGEDVYLPHPSGDFSVGTKSFALKDTSRKPFRGTSENRWMVQAYYPSEFHNGTYPYMPHTIKNGMVEGVTVYSHAKPNAVISMAEKYPLIIFIPGLGGERQKYTILCERLASHGWIVLSFDTPYVSNFVSFPDDEKIVLTLKDAWNVPRNREYRYQYYDEAMSYVMDNIDYTLKNLDDINHSKMAGSIDLSKVVLMGHSFGGNIAHTMGFVDKRIRAVVDIDSKITEREVYGRFGVPPNTNGIPVLFVRGMMQYQEDVGEQLLKISHATIWEPNVEHSAFSDNGYFANKISNFGQNRFLSELKNWFFKRGPHWDNVDTSLGDKDVDEWFMEYTGYIVKWLDGQRK